MLNIHTEDCVATVESSVLTLILKIYKCAINEGTVKMLSFKFGNGKIFLTSLIFWWLRIKYY